MAIVFQQLTTAVGASVQAANTALLDAIKALVVTHPNWTVVEDSNLGTTPYRWLVFKCAASGSQPNDIYVLFVDSVNANGTFSFYVGESYTLATHTLGGVANANNSSLAIDATGRAATPTSYAPAATGQPTVAGTMNSTMVYTTTFVVTTIYWQMGVYDDHLVFQVATSQSAIASSGAYMGGYESLVPTPATNDPVRCIVVPLSTAAQYTSPTIGGVSGAASRVPLQLASATRTQAGNIVAPGSAIPNALGLDFGRAVTSATDSIQGAGVLHLSKILVIDLSYTAAEGSIRSSVRGRLNNMLGGVGVNNIAAIAPGDTISYGGFLWAFAGNYTLLETGVAG